MKEKNNNSYQNSSTQSEQKVNNNLSRRKFISTTAAAAALSTGCSSMSKVDVVPREVIGGPGQPSPSEKLNIAGVGVGGVGYGQMGSCADGNNIVALCDVDDEYASRAYRKWPQARKYRDFRAMLDTETDIDAVYVGTPDHTHAIIVKAAIEKGKHVCCVKPLTRTIHESRVLMHTARDMKVATQITASSNTDDRACTTCEWIWNGAIGDVLEVHCWSNRPLWPQGMVRPEGADPIPDTFDWQMWLGPAPQRPFKDEWPEDHLTLQQLFNKNPRRAVYHPWNFRGWWDFGTGALGDMGCHHFNAVFRALKLRYPTSVHASATKVMEETTPLASIVTWQYPARADMPPVKLFWYDGGLKPPRPDELDGNEDWPAEGNMLIGTEGILLLNSGKPRLLPESRAKRFKAPPKVLVRKNSIWKEWFEACKGGEPASCNFDLAAPLTEHVLLGNIAIRTGKNLEYNANAMKFTNNEEANQYVQEPYHNGWTL